ncbi:hypothetical protein DFH01_21635 [Falsiroseomonas bella]|uniref:DUF1468 domain-containing protein n=1 Tax=Falsiroseomonas bella TaxID=2184016 RepID=A0A317F7B6_9PROT|nr:tripartite tricarboxylate transporter TctB family protein [Falsiroseomonas bella]PWS34944.1 hypothetical protein DFH01_21635 [Falsiroseomonas bella]
MRRVSWGDLGLSAGFAAMGLVWIAGAREMPMWERETPGPGWLPLAFGVLLVGLSAAAALQALIWPAAAPEGGGSVRKPLLVLGATLAAVLGLELIGFLPAVFLMLLVLFVLAERKALLPSLLAALGVSAALHLIFVTWLGVPLPAGPFGG